MVCKPHPKSEHRHRTSLKQQHIVLSNWEDDDLGSGIVVQVEPLALHEQLVHKPIYFVGSMLLSLLFFRYKYE
jgi:hypothetical protein